MKEFIYKLVDLVTFGKGLKRTINGHTLRLPTRYVKYFPTDYETDNFTLLVDHCKAGNTLLDIGAHIGMFSVIASKLTGPGGKVYAFEPTPSTTRFLKNTIAINHAENLIETVQKAVGKEEGHTTFFISDDKADNSNSMVSYLDDRKLHGIDIVVTTIDAFVAEKKLNAVHFIKIDVEGAEYDTLRGGINTLKNLKPVCIVSIHPVGIKAKGDKLEDIYDLIANLNYKIYFEQQLIDKAAFCANVELMDLHIIPA